MQELIGLTSVRACSCECMYVCARVSGMQASAHPSATKIVALRFLTLLFLFRSSYDGSMTDMVLMLPAIFSFFFFHLTQQLESFRRALVCTRPSVHDVLSPYIVSFYAFVDEPVRPFVFFPSGFSFNCAL